VDGLRSGVDAVFILLGAIMILAMHAGFAFLELGTVRRKNQVNALVKILVDFAVSTIAYFFVGYSIAYGIDFFGDAQSLAANNGFELVRFFFLLTFAAAIPAIISGGIAERAKFYPQLAATALLVGLVYPFFEGMVWNHHFGLQAWLMKAFSAEFHDFAGSVVVHAVGGWVALAAVLLLGARRGRYSKEGAIAAHPPSNIPFLALGAWILTIGWFGFNVMSAQTLDKMNGLVALNSLMAMVGGTLVAVLLGRNDPGGPGCRVCRFRPDASARCTGHRRHCGRNFRADVYADAKQVEGGRRAGGVAAAWFVRRMGRYRSRYFRAEGIGRDRRRVADVAIDRHRTGDSDRPCLRVRHLRIAQALCRSASRSGRGVRRRRSFHSQDRCDG
jgi:hypothetical protein